MKRQNTRSVVTVMLTSLCLLAGVAVGQSPGQTSDTDPPANAQEETAQQSVEQQQSTEQQSPASQQAPPASQSQPAPELDAVQDALRRGVLSSEDLRLEDVRLQLEELLTATGLPTDAERHQIAKRLESLSLEQEETGKRVQLESQKAQAYNNNIRIDLALQQRAGYNKDKREYAYRGNRVRASARNLKNLEEPGADVMGDFYLMQADLTDVNNNDFSLKDRQEQAIELFETFIENDTRRNEQRMKRTARSPRQAPSPSPSQTTAQVSGQVQRLLEEAGPAEAHQATRDVKLALLRLYDQRGDSDKARKLLGELQRTADATNNGVLRHELDEWYGYCDAVGRVLDARVQTTDGKFWSSREQVGKVVLIHFWAHWFAQSTQTFAPLRKAHERYKDRGLSILSVDLGGAEPQGRAADVIDWPMCRKAPGPKTLRQLLSVRSVPRYVVLDRKGRVASVGGSLAVLEQVEALLDEPQTLPVQQAELQVQEAKPAAAANAPAGQQVAPDPADR